MLEKFKSINEDMLSGIILIFATILALIFSNTSLSEIYHWVLHAHLTISLDGFGVDKSLLHWINDGLMAVFFLLVGLEIKREILRGHLSSVSKAALPIVAALGGVVTPALIYTLFNFGDDHAMRGWAIPMATDIAFAVGVFALLGDRVPKQLRLLLLSLAIIDDLLAIVVIAVFYGEDLSLTALAYSVLFFAVAVVLNRMKIKQIAPYIVVGAAMWVCLIHSGVHATLAGVFLALCIPIDGKTKKNGAEIDSPLETLEHALYPWVAFFIMPIFAFANAGISLAGFSPSLLSTSIPLGIICGLFLGKQLGVFSFIFFGCKFKLCSRPEGVNWAQIYGLAIITGVGFTMSFFIGSLAFTNSETIMLVRSGVMVGSLCSAICGYLFLYFLFKLRVNR